MVVLASNLPIAILLRGTPWLTCRYCSLMKKGSNAAETVREGVAGLWRKGADMKWSVPAGAEKAAVGTALLSSLSYGRPGRHASDTMLHGFLCCSWPGFRLYAAWSAR